MPSRLCNRCPSRNDASALLAALLTLLGSCQAPHRAGTPEFQTLRTARPRPLRPLARVHVSGLPLPANLATPLTNRLWLIELHNRRDWQHLRQLAPALGPPPDFSRGVVVGLLWRCGQPLAGRWPLLLRSARVADGAAMLEARTLGGSFLLDTTGYLTLAQLPGARYVAAVDLGSQRFYPAAGSTRR